jgi:hypothetical protein
MKTSHATPAQEGVVMSYLGSAEIKQLVARLAYEKGSTISAWVASAVHEKLARVALEKE